MYTSLSLSSCLSVFLSLDVYISPSLSIYIYMYTIHTQTCPYTFNFYESIRKICEHIATRMPEQQLASHSAENQTR